MIFNVIYFDFSDYGISNLSLMFSEIKQDLKKCEFVKNVFAK